MKLAAVPLLALLATIATPANACLPPPPGYIEPPPPTKEERARKIFGWSTDIVYGAVVGDGDKLKFKVIHVYKGALKAGQVIQAKASWGFDAPPCASMMGSPIPSRGQYGVIAFSTEPELNFVGDELLRTLFDTKLIISARR